MLLTVQARLGFTWADRVAPRRKTKRPDFKPQHACARMPPAQFHGAAHPVASLHTFRPLICQGRGAGSLKVDVPLQWQKMDGLPHGWHLGGHGRRHGLRRTGAGGKAGATGRRKTGGLFPGSSVRTPAHSQGDSQLPIFESLERFPPCLKPYSSASSPSPEHMCFPVDLKRILYSFCYTESVLSRSI